MKSSIIILQMPNADSSDRTRFLRLKAMSNDTLFDNSTQTYAIDQRKFRATSPDGILPLQIKYSLSKFLPGTGNHSIAAAQQISASRPKLK